MEAKTLRDTEGLYEQFKYVRNYYLIFRKDGGGGNVRFGRMVFVLGDEDVARQFCADFPEYYYLRRDQVIDDNNTWLTHDPEEEARDDTYVDTEEDRESDTWLHPNDYAE